MAAEIKIKKARVTKAKPKSGSGAIKVRRVRTSPELDHLIQANTVVPPEPLAESYSPRPLYQDPFVEEMIADKIQGSRLSWTFRLYRKIAVSFVVLSLVALAAVGYFAVVRLDIAVTPRETAVEGTTSFKVYDRPADYAVPAGSTLGVVRALEAEASVTQAASGKKVSGAELSGTVTLVNGYIKDQPLVATTRLLTPDGQLLRLRNTVTVPAGGQVEAEVYGEASDPSFSLADSRLTIPGLWAGLQDKIYADAKAGSVRYQEKGTSFVTADDIAAATILAKAALLEKAKQDIEETYADYSEKLFSLDEKSLKVVASAKADDEATGFKATASGTITIVAFKRDSVKDFTNTALSAAVPNGVEVDAAAARPAFSILQADTEDNIAEVSMKTAASAAASDPEALIDRTKIISLRRPQLEGYLKSLPMIESYELKFTPSFWPLTPSLADRITVHLK